jgi:hypothetical protein
MSRSCSRCGAAASPRARFCADCGARLGTDPGAAVLNAPELQAVTEEVPAVDEHAADHPRPGSSVGSCGDRRSTVPAIPAIADAIARRWTGAPGNARVLIHRGETSWWDKQRGHGSRNAVAFCALLIALAITVAWMLGGNGGSRPGTSQRASRSAVARTPRRTTRRRDPSSPDILVHAYLIQLEGILQQSAAGRSQLAGTVRSVQPACGSSSLGAEQQITNVVANRTDLLHRLDALGPGPNPSVQAVSALLHQALQASTQADAQYQAWAAALVNSPSDQCAADPSAAAALAAAHADDFNATTLKTQFVDLFDPLAAQYGLTGWSQADF